MARYVALLYSIVLGGEKRVTAADLNGVAAAAGFSAPRALLATGNLLFDAPDQSEAAVEAALESAFKTRHGKPVPIIVRRAEDWLALAVGNPFPAESAFDGSRVAVRVQRDRLREGILDQLMPLLDRNEQVKLVDGNLWASFPAQMSTTRLLRALTPKRLGVGTMRNWNTVRRIADALSV